MGNWIGALLAVIVALVLFLLLGLFWLVGTVLESLHKLTRPT